MYKSEYADNRLFESQFLVALDMLVVLVESCYVLNTNQVYISISNSRTISSERLMSKSFKSSFLV